jgi:hypothetical protein
MCALPPPVPTVGETAALGIDCRNRGGVESPDPCRTEEADIKACFDEIDHSALLGRVRGRIGDKRVLGLVKAFLRAGILTEDGQDCRTITGTPRECPTNCVGS